MLVKERDDVGITTYTVYNSAGQILIRTSSSKIAYYVEYYVRKGVNPELRLSVGGDKGTLIEQHLWIHKRKFRTR